MPAGVAAYVDAVAALVEMPLDAQRRGAVIATMERLASFAADVAAAPLGIDVEIAGEFHP